MTVPAHFLARSVDVVTEPTYLYREREDGVPSITQRRAELRILRDRFTAVEQVSAFLGARSAAAKRWYDTSVVEDDLRYHVDVLDAADDAYRAYFLDRANAFLDAAAPAIERTLPPIQRRKWQLVRERRLDDLLALVAFQKAGGRIGGPLDTARRRARHAVTLTRPYWTPHRPITKRRLLARRRPPPPRCRRGSSRRRPRRSRTASGRAASARRAPRSAARGRSRSRAARPSSRSRPRAPR